MMQLLSGNYFRFNLKKQTVKHTLVKTVCPFSVLENDSQQPLNALCSPVFKLHDMLRDTVTVDFNTGSYINSQYGSFGED